jgi:hypothetical protein
MRFSLKVRFVLSMITILTMLIVAVPASSIFAAGSLTC